MQHSGSDAGMHSLYISGDRLWKDGSTSDSFTADSLEYGIMAGDTDTDISYFAKDLCVTDGDVEAVSADTSESYAALFFNVDTREVLYAKISMTGYTRPVQQNL